MAKKASHKRILNCLPSKDIQDDWTYQTALESGIVTEASVPTSKDLRESWWRINDQGSTGSCVGWATVDSVLRWHFVKKNLLDDDELLSPRYIWMAAKETDEFTSRPSTFIESEGTSLKAALDITRKFGCILDRILPFNSGHLYSGDVRTFYAIAAQLRISGYINLGQNLAEWRNWIANKGPILTRLNVDATWDNVKSTKGNLDVYQPETATGGHAIALVGYTPERFIVRNSWGSSWGDKGFGYASVSYAQEAFTEAYGVDI